MPYTVAMILLDQLKDSDKGLPAEPLPGTFSSADEANGAGMLEIERRDLPPGAISFEVYDSDGNKVDEAGMGLS